MNLAKIFYQSIHRVLLAEEDEVYFKVPSYSNF